jgi:eukaryotic-like serine/threonine-protein kinase
MGSSSSFDDTINYRVTPFGRTLCAHPGEDIPSAVGRFRVLDRLASGGMGVVVRAYDDMLDREVAVKVSAATAGRRAGHEPRVLGKFHHPGIIAVHEAGTLADGRGYFAMPLVEGRTLSSLLLARSSPADDLPRWLGAFERVCRAVEHAHERGIVHRDLKPSNVMVCGTGRAYVLDWGVAREAGAPDEDGQWVCGTPAYMAPEQFHPTVADPRSDVFGLGAILCEILTGDAPYVGLVPAAVTLRASEADQQEVRGRLARSGAPAELVRLVEDCLTPDLAARPADAGEVARRVAAYLAEPESPPSVAAPPAEESRVSGVFAATALTIACIMAAVIVPKLRAHHAPPPVSPAVEQPITTG